MRYCTKGKKIAFDLVPGGAGQRALDVGCRDGYWSEHLKRKGYIVASVDIEPEYEQAITVDSNERLPFDDDAFSLVWCSEVIEHLRDPAFTIGEFRRVLKPGGYITLTTPNKDFWFFRLFEWLGVGLKAIQNQEHTCALSYADIRDLLGGCELHGYFPYVIAKRRITKGAGLLSPTIVARYCNEKPYGLPSCGNEHETQVMWLASSGIAR